MLPKMSAEDILMYLRKSRTDDPALTVEEVLSKHEQMLDDWVERNLSDSKIKIPESNRYREVVSGETIESRPKVQELLRRIESPRIKAVLIVEPQRLSRGDLEDIGRLVKLLRYTNTIVITLQYSYDLRDERDRDMFERELKRGNEFLEYQKRIMGNGRLLSVQNGNFIGQKPPYGYKKVVIKDGKRKCHTLEPDPERAPVVKMVFEMYASGTSAAQIAKTLRNMGIETNEGGKWSASSVKHMLTNDHYIGMVHWEKRKTVKVVEDGEVRATRPRSNDFLVYQGKHPPIIEKELWDAVQAIKGKLPPVKEKAKNANPFAGIVFCQCGSRMSRRQYFRDGVERCSPRLLCDNQTQCGTASCTLEEFSDAVIDALEKAIADFDIKLASNQDDQILIHEQVIARLESRLNELDRIELSQWDKYTQEAMPKHIFDRLNEKVIQERTAVLSQLEAAKRTIPPKEDYAQKRMTFISAVNSLKDAEVSVKEKNLLLKQCIEKVVYNRKKKESDNRRFGTPEPLELDFHFKV
ncbi:MAG: recombinase family protein [Faecousia sp.]